jgi:phosphoglycerol geranylgeranyltransferase
MQSRKILYFIILSIKTILLFGAASELFMIYQSILSLSGKKKILALLIDPEETSQDVLPALIDSAAEAGVSMVLVGGSLVNNPLGPLLDAIRKICSLPVLLFPGTPGQLSDNADGILLLSLISGRNPEFLIGNHVVAAQFLKKSSLEIIPTGYMLIENGKTSSAEYMSNTRPLPVSKPDLVVSTALAGEMLGLKLIYLEGGSGAPGIIPAEIISAVKQNISVPLVVGGGIRSAGDLKQVYEAGADIAVVGNAVENDTTKLLEFAQILK